MVTVIPTIVASITTVLRMVGDGDHQDRAGLHERV
jgi:hypothetical protein